MKLNSNTSNTNTRIRNRAIETYRLFATADLNDITGHTLTVVWLVACTS
jgi:hypothetical protein